MPISWPATHGVDNKSAARLPAINPWPRRGSRRRPAKAEHRQQQQADRRQEQCGKKFLQRKHGSKAGLTQRLFTIRAAIIKTNLPFPAISRGFGAARWARRAWRRMPGKGGWTSRRYRLAGRPAALKLSSWRVKYLVVALLGLAAAQAPLG